MRNVWKRWRNSWRFTSRNRSSAGRDTEQYVDLPKGEEVEGQMKEYRKRLYLSVLGMLISLTAGCQTSGSLSGEVKQTNASLSIDVLKDELIYWEPVIQEFQKRYPDVQVEICSYSAEEMVETASKRETELMAGEGKDIYLSIESSGFDFYKVQQSGVFADLYPFFQEEPGFSEENYLAGMFDIFENEETCCIVPTQAIFSACVTTKTINEEIPVPLNELEDYQDFVRDKMYFVKQYPDRKDLPVESDSGEYNARWGVDIQDGQKSFEQLFQSDFWKMEQQLTRHRRKSDSDTIPMDWAHMEEFQKNISGYMEKKRYMCLDAQVDLAFQLYCQLGGKDRAVIASVPDVSGNTVVYPAACVAVSQNSPNKENAFRLLKIMLEEEFQKRNGGPVVKEYLTGEVWKDAYGQENLLIQGVACPGVDEETIDSLAGHFRNGTMAGGLLTSTKEKYSECMEGYYTGEKPLEACAEEFLAYLNIYCSE